MSESASATARKVPGWLIVTGSVAIAAHLIAVGALVLAAPSGPWSTPYGPSTALPPQFASLVNDVTANHYLRWVKLTHNYHFMSNRTGLPGVEFEVRLKDRSGNVIKVVTIPDKEANAFARHRQALLARGLAEDIPIPPPAGEVIAAPGQKVRTIQIWDLTKDGKLELRTVPEHLVPRNRPVFRVSEWSVLLARSYARYLCREHNAASAELVRRTQDPIPPAVLFMEGNPPPGVVSPVLVANFGELPRE